MVKMELTQIVTDYVAKKEEYKAKKRSATLLVEKRKNQLKWAEGRANKLLVRYPSWIDNIVKPIAKEMVKQMQDRYYDIRGPYGLSSETTIHFYKKGVSGEEKFENDNCISITFVPRDLRKGELLLRDYTQNTHRYSEGSIGEINCRKFSVLPIKDSIDELMEWMKQQNAKKEAGEDE